MAAVPIYVAVPGIEFRQVQVAASGASTPIQQPAYCVAELPLLDGHPVRPNVWYYAERGQNVYVFGMRAAPPTAQPFPPEFFLGIGTHSDSHGQTVWTSDATATKDLATIVKSECQRGKTMVPLTADMLPRVIRRLAFGATAKRDFTSKMSEARLPWRTEPPSGYNAPPDCSKLAASVQGAIDAELLEKRLIEEKAAEGAAVAERSAGLPAIPGGRVWRRRRSRKLQHTLDDGKSSV